MIEFAKEGAYTDMYKGQRSDLGFVSGLLGFRPEDQRLRQSFEIAKEMGVDVQFKISNFEPIVPNIARITMMSDQNEIVVIYSDSTGGGTVKLLKVDDFDISIVGDCFELLVYINSSDPQVIEAIKKMVESKFVEHEGIAIATVENKSLLNIKLREAVNQEMIDSIKKIDKITEVKLISPILVVASNRNTKMPFVSAADLLAISERDNKELWELGLEYECERSGWSADEVMDYMKYVITTMESGIQEALKGDINMNGIIKPSAGKIDKTCKEGKNLDGHGSS